MKLRAIVLETPDAQGLIALRFLVGSKGAAHTFMEDEDAHSVASKLHMLAVEIENQAWEEVNRK